MGPPGHVFGFGTYGRVGSFLVLGTYGGWVATLENPFGTLEALETLGTLCVALCGDKVRTIFHVAAAVAGLRRYDIYDALLGLYCRFAGHCCRVMFV